MGFRGPVVALGALFALLVGCRTATPPAIDPELASCVPADAQVIAGIHLERVRANAALQKTFGAWLPLLDRAGDATFVLIAYNGKDLLWAGSGQFRTAPPGATLLSPKIAVTGSEPMVRAAKSQHAAGRTGAPRLLTEAQSVAAQPVWAVIAGNAKLPLSGNAANVSRLLGMTEETAFAIEANQSLTIHVTGICNSVDQARRLEETLRGMATLALATSHNQALSKIVAAIQIHSDNRRVHADLTGGEELIQQLLSNLQGGAASTGR